VLHCLHGQGCVAAYVSISFIVREKWWRQDDSLPEQSGAICEGGSYSSSSEGGVIPGVPVFLCFRSMIDRPRQGAVKYAKKG